MPPYIQYLNYLIRDINRSDWKEIKAFGQKHDLSARSLLLKGLQRQLTYMSKPGDPIRIAAARLTNK